MAPCLRDKVRRHEGAGGDDVNYYTYDMSQLSGRQLLLVAAAFAVVSVIIILYTVVTGAGQIVLSTYGISTRATVTGKFETEYKEDYIIEYEFSLKDQALILGTSRVDYDDHWRIKTGEPAAVIYLASYPQLNRLEISGFNEVYQVAFFGVFGLMVAFFAFTFFKMGYSKLHPPEDAVQPADPKDRSTHRQVSDKPTFGKRRR